MLSENSVRSFAQISLSKIVGFKTVRGLLTLAVLCGLTATAEAQAIQHLTVEGDATYTVAGSLHAGDTVKVHVNFYTDDSDDPDEDEPFMLQSTSGFSQTFDYGEADTTFVAANDGDTLSGSIEDGDYDETAELTVTVCPAAVNGVDLPSINTPFAPSATYSGADVFLNFAETGNMDPSVFCEYQSNKGTLLLSLNIFGVPNVFASSTVATLTLFNPSTTAPIPVGRFVGVPVANHCLLNGPYDASHYYARWTSPGFQIAPIAIYIVSLLTGLPAYFPTPALEYWVDLDNLGETPDVDTVDGIVRSVESYLHTSLTKDVVIPAMIGAVPESDQLLALNSTSGFKYNRRTGTFDGTVTLVNVGDVAVSAPIQVDLAGLPVFVHLANRSGTFFEAPYITLNASLAPGGSVTIPVSFNNPLDRTISYSVQTYSGTFYTAWTIL